MNIAELQRKLIAAARSNQPSDRVPFAFEKRIMAQLAVLFSAWSLLAPGAGPAANDLSQEMENTVLVAVDQEPVTDSTW